MLVYILTTLQIAKSIARRVKDEWTHTQHWLNDTEKEKPVSMPLFAPQTHTERSGTERGPPRW